MVYVMAASLIIDGALLLVFALIVLWSAKRGLLAAVLSLACWIFSVVVAGVLSMVIAQPVYDSLAAQTVRNMIEANIDDAVTGNDATRQAGKLLAELPESLRELADFSGISTDALVDKLETMPKDGKSAAELLESAIVAPIAVAAIRLGLCLALFVILLLVTRLITRQLERAGKLPVIKQANHALGAVLGVVKGALVLFVLCLLLRVAAELSDDTAFKEAVGVALLPRILVLKL